MPGDDQDLCGDDTRIQTNWMLQIMLNELDKALSISDFEADGADLARVIGHWASRELVFFRNSIRGARDLGKKPL